MSFTSLKLSGRRALHRSRWLQIGVLSAIWWPFDRLASALSLPMPGGVLGMAALLILLLSGRVPAGWLRRGSSSLLDHMILFFVPATLAVLDHRELMSLVGLKVLLVIVAGTVAVMTTTALAVEFCFRLGNRHA
ncbi:LrgA family protein [Desulfovibrio sp. X2]|uniref:CidA/LrgA family protein n=1 Tax=Desulfovibrio sp. X2 TaxID=941449 RepID=UPI000358BC0B|nr:CidA/LrgA family protein [Desulfovibrio sp. X2]EPR43733.1 LrgA family protein [Desulfovibrio sp. X2]